MAKLFAKKQKMTKLFAKKNMTKQICKKGGYDKIICRYTFFTITRNGCVRNIFIKTDVGEKYSVFDNINPRRECNIDIQQQLVVNAQQQNRITLM